MESRLGNRLLLVEATTRGSERDPKFGVGGPAEGGEGGFAGGEECRERFDKKRRAQGDFEGDVLYDLPSRFTMKAANNAVTRTLYKREPGGGWKSPSKRLRGQNALPPHGLDIQRRGAVKVEPPKPFCPISGLGWAPARGEGASVGRTAKDGRANFFISVVRL